MSTPTSELAFGDLCKFWDQHGLFIGVVEPTEVDVEDAPENTVNIRFLLEGESYRRVSSLRFTHLPPKFEPSDFVFVKLLVDDDVKVLPRAEKRSGWDCNDGLVLLSRA